MSKCSSCRDDNRVKRIKVVPKENGFSIEIKYEGTCNKKAYVVRSWDELSSVIKRETEYQIDLSAPDIKPE